MGLNNILLRIKAKGYIPVLAHPERYTYMNEKDYWRLKGMNVRFQLNLLSLIGAHGPEVRGKAEWLLKNGYYQLCGTDIHSLTLWKESVNEEKNIRENVSRMIARHHSDTFPGIVNGTSNDNSSHEKQGQAFFTPGKSRCPTINA